MISNYKKAHNLCISFYTVYIYMNIYIHIYIVLIYIYITEIYICIYVYVLPFGYCLRPVEHAAATGNLDSDEVMEMQSVRLGL